MKRVIMLLISVLYISGCSTHITDFSMISNKNVNLNKVDIDKLPQSKNVIGEDKKFVFLFIPTGVPSITNALNDAFDKTDTDIMTDVTLKSWYWYIPYIYGNAGWEVSGDAIKTRRN
ncbi:MAG: hypothetical protein OSJ76_07245 [Alphaproteobacteria bacterium]|nr:hypothetical protein [Alphaproteobacteria bacterium]